MTIQPAFFISPTGEVISVKRTHIEKIISDPERFGLTAEKIGKTYEKYGERLPLEGKAREELIRETIKTGWIRLRKHVNKQWSITANRWDDHTKNRIKQWAAAILSEGISGILENDKYMPVKIVLIHEENSIEDLTISDLAEL